MTLAMSDCQRMAAAYSRLSHDGIGFGWAAKSGAAEEGAGDVLVSAAPAVHRTASCRGKGGTLSEVDPTARPPGFHGERCTDRTYLHRAEVI
jgi:hypothetical protein